MYGLKMPLFNIQPKASCGCPEFVFCLYSVKPLPYKILVFVSLIQKTTHARLTLNANLEFYRGMISSKPFPGQYNYDFWDSYCLILLECK